MWYRATDPWHQEQMRPKSGTKWHLIDESRSDGPTVFAACEQGIYGMHEHRERVLTAEAERTRPGSVVPTPGRGAICARCYRLACRAMGLA